MTVPENITVLTQGNLRWINIEQLDRAAVDYLRAHFNFHLLDYEDITGTTHRSKIDSYPEYLFLIMLFPVFNRSTKQMIAGEIDFFLGDNYLVTIHRNNIPTFIDLFQLCEASAEAREQYLGQSAQFLLYKILQRLFKYCYPLLDEIDFRIDSIEPELFSSGEQKLLQDILFIRHNIIDMRKIIQPHRATLFRLKKATAELASNYEDYFDDLIDYTQEIWNQLESFKEAVEALHETNQSLISYRMNDVVKTLTVFSAIMLPAGFITGIFSMNSHHIPFTDSPIDFWIFCSITLLSMLPIILYMRKKRLL